MSIVDTSTVIAAPPAAVWAIVMNPRRLGEWVSIHRRLGAVSDGAPRTGFRMEQVMQLRGASFKVQWHLSRCEAERLAHWEGQGPAHARAEIEYRLSPQEAGTLFHYSNRFHPPLGPLGALASRALIGGISEREAVRSLAQLKALVEGEQAT